MSDVIISESSSPGNSSSFSKSTIITSTPSKVIEDSREISHYNERQSFETPRSGIIMSSDTDDVDGIKSKTPRHCLGGIQTTLDSPTSVNTKSSPPQDDQIKCERSDYNQQSEKIRQYEPEMMKKKNQLSTIKLSVLPNKSELLKAKFETFKNNFLSAQDRLLKMIVIEEDHPETNLEAGIASVELKTFGKKGLENYNIQKALTVERLEQLHGFLENCPTNNHFAEDPKGLKVGLMAHQKTALAWLEYRELQKPSDGILADDMGLGKTLTMKALILKTRSHICAEK
ncbi:hypothetical protein WA026_011291 [Henosepilachna vigintioctopunctata]|uniref:SNF2 N-terminal domain-containing protein n=1 Tax=Henosepilachna vigintioctopunctata TaxID=420089 RepID=A0AAW1U6A6_9CUCU